MSQVAQVILVVQVKQMLHIVHSDGAGDISGMALRKPPIWKIPLRTIPTLPPQLTEKSPLSPLEISCITKIPPPLQEVSPCRNFLTEKFPWEIYISENKI